MSKGDSGNWSNGQSIAARHSISSWFKPSGRDAQHAAEIIDGRLSIAGLEWQVFADTGWRVHPLHERNQALVFHSLRWLDPLRRTTKYSGDASEKTWINLVESWNKSFQEGELDPDIIWAPICASHRARTLALGFASYRTTHLSECDLLRLHIDQLIKKVGAGVTSHTPDILVSILICALVLHDDELIEYVAAATRDLFMKVFDEQGVGSAGSFYEQERSITNWSILADHFEVEGISFAHQREVLNRSNDFFTHGTTPAGHLLSMGYNKPLRRDHNSDQMNYVSSNGSRGSAPDSLNFVSEKGFIFCRSGWGETERDFKDETFYSILFGSYPKAGGHQDGSSVTFSSRGTNWIIDPVGSVDGDLEVARRDHHSSLVIDSVQMRSNSKCDLVWHRRDELIDDTLLADTAYRPIQFRRRIIYSRHGEYLVVVDKIKSSECLKGTQKWMLDPDIQLKQFGNRVHLSHGASHAVMQWPLTDGADIGIEVVLDSSGQAIAQSISVMFESDAKARIVMVIYSVRSFDTYSLETRDHKGPELALVVNSGFFEELLVISDEGSMTGSVTDVTNEAVIRMNERISLGSRPNVDEPARRLLARECLQQVKQAVWKQDATVDARTAAIRRLISFAKDNGIDGLRDYGIGSALIDLGADDLTALVANDVLVKQQNRVPVIQWPNRELDHAFYQAPIYSHRAVPGTFDGFPDESIHSIDYGDLVLPAYVESGEGDTVLVNFHGATDRIKNTMPRFERIRTMRSLNMGSSLFFSDPGMDLDMGMILSWFAGTDQLNLHEQIAKFVTNFSSYRSQPNIVLIGNSGGAFAALQVSSYIPGSTVIAFNPQTEIDRYSPRMAELAHMNLFGSKTVRDRGSLQQRMNVIKRFDNIDFDRNVLLVQNTGDAHHLEHHFEPLVKAFHASSHGERLRTHTPFIGPGHRVPPPDEYLRLVSEGIAWARGQ